MKYKVFLIFLISLYSCQKENQKSGNIVVKDSIGVYFNTIDTSKSLLLKNSANETVLRSLDNSVNDSLTRENLFRVANNFFSQNNWDGFKRTIKIVLEKSSTSRDSVNIAKAYRYYGEYYKNIYLIDSAFYYYLKSEKYYAKLNDKTSLGRVLLKKGIVQFYANDYLGADISTSKAYNLLKDSNEKEIVNQAISMKGIIANEMKDYQAALAHHKDALELIRKFGLNNSLNQEATSLNNIGNVYQNLDNNVEAIKHFNLALSDPNVKSRTPDLYAILLDNLGYSKLKLKKFDGLPDIFITSLKIRDSLKIFSGMVLSNIHLSEYYAIVGDTSRSQMYAKQAMAISRLNRAPTDVLASLKQLSLVEHIKSSNYTQEYIKINDSLQQAERQSQNKFARLQLETDEILQEKDILAQQNRNLVYFFVGTLMIGLLLFIIKNQRSKNRELLLKQAQQKANEEIYNMMINQQVGLEEGRMKEKKRIAQELHDGVLGRLFGTRLNLDSLNKMSDSNSVTKRDTYLSELKMIEQDIREISHDLNREKFVLINNFLAILNNLFEEQRALFNSKLYVVIDEAIKWEFINNTQKINIYRIIQESLQNINKYAHASQINISIALASNTIRLIIKDDGAGFEISHKKKGIGIQNMISRTQELNGVFDIRSSKGDGTVISVNIPVL